MGYKILMMLFSLSSCVPNSHQLAGEYENNPKLSIWDKVEMVLFRQYKPVSIINLQLFEDSTFMLTDCSEIQYGKWSSSETDIIFYYDFYVKRDNISDTIFYDYNDNLYAKMKIKGNTLIEILNDNMTIVYIKK